MSYYQLSRTIKSYQLDRTINYQVPIYSIGTDDSESDSNRFDSKTTREHVNAGPPGVVFATATNWRKM